MVILKKKLLEERLKSKQEAYTQNIRVSEVTLNGIVKNVESTDIF